MCDRFELARSYTTLRTVYGTDGINKEWENEHNRSTTCFLEGDLAVLIELKKYDDSCYYKFSFATALLADITPISLNRIRLRCNIPVANWHLNTVHSTRLIRKFLAVVILATRMKHHIHIKYTDERMEHFIQRVLGFKSCVARLDYESIRVEQTAQGLLLSWIANESKSYTW